MKIGCQIAQRRGVAFAGMGRIGTASGGLVHHHDVIRIDLHLDGFVRRSGRHHPTVGQRRRCAGQGRPRRRGVIRHGFRPVAGHVGIGERSFGHGRWIVVDGLLEKVGTDDGHFADFPTVDQLGVADDVASIAGTVTAKIAKEELVGSASSSSCWTRGMIRDPLRQLEKLQTGQRRSAELSSVSRVSDGSIRTLRMSRRENFGADFRRDAQRLENLVDIRRRVGHPTGSRIEFANRPGPTHNAGNVIILAQIRITAIEMDADVGAHSAQSVAAVAADGAPERSHVRMRLHVLLCGCGRGADDIAARAFPPLRLDGSRSTCSWTCTCFVIK